ncbi:uncharacterized protein VTP21DRAFT_9676 [Calcarisporiella thermophila]|uniref:uncharacterized protein n=1 Tax=Calcarisporiella thermophila TaxID=911321 RepID=UPI00374323F3
MAWGCTTAHGVGYLCRINEGLNAQLYCKILSEEYRWTLEYYGVDKSEVIFQHDNDPKHTANITKAWLQDNKLQVLEWPSQSPDLNIMEHMWSELKRRLANYRRMPMNKDELWERIETEWESIDKEYIGKLYESMPERIRAVCFAKGGHTKY